MQDQVSESGRPQGDLHPIRNRVSPHPHPEDRAQRGASSPAPAGGAAWDSSVGCDLDEPTGITQLSWQLSYR